LARNEDSTPSHCVLGWGSATTECVCLAPLQLPARKGRESEPPCGESLVICPLSSLPLKNIPVPF
jgi:hypothetical protein